MYAYPVEGSSIAALNKSGIKSDFYHAGLSSAQRARRQEAWKSGKVPVVVATNAFGMGIDKADVGWWCIMTCRTVRKPIFKRRDVPDGMGNGHTPCYFPAGRLWVVYKKRIDDAFPRKIIY